MKKIAVLLSILMTVFPIDGKSKTKTHRVSTHHHHSTHRPQAKKRIADQDLKCRKVALCGIIAYRMTDRHIKRLLDAYETPKYTHSKIIVEINRAAIKHNLPKSLLVTVIAQESAFNRKAISRAGAKGMMQIMPIHKVRRPFDIHENIDAGAGILRGYIDNADGNVINALARYGNGHHYIGELSRKAKQVKEAA